MVSFSTPRLRVYEYSADIAISNQSLLDYLPTGLTKPVVAHLPLYFREITTPEQAKGWLEHTLSDSRLFVALSPDDTEYVGLVVLHETNEGHGYIGYLLFEPFWGKGLAQEMLWGFCEFANQHTDLEVLSGGIDKDNAISAHVMEKVGFEEIPSDQDGVVLFSRALVRQKIR